MQGTIRPDKHDRVVLVTSKSVSSSVRKNSDANKTSLFTRYRKTHGHVLLVTLYGKVIMIVRNGRKVLIVRFGKVR